jgi:NADP-dependent 3-hydroxy acid dehydrogenase YdfG
MSVRRRSFTILGLFCEWARILDEWDAIAEGVTSSAMRARLTESSDRFAMPPDAIARAITFAIEQPADVDVNEAVIRPTAQV